MAAVTIPLTRLTRLTLRSRAHRLQRQPPPWSSSLSTSSLAAAPPPRPPNLDPASRNNADHKEVITAPTAKNDGGRTIDSGTGDRRAETNASPDEVDKFASFASRWWDSRSNPLVGMNPVRVKFMRDTVARVSRSAPTATEDENCNHAPFHLPFRDKRVLDIGCGGGLLTESFSRLGASLVVGVDASSKVVEVAKMHSFHENSNLTLERRNKPSFNNPDERKIIYAGGRTVEEFASQWLSEREKELRTTSSSPSNNHRSAHEPFDMVTALEVIEHVPDPATLLRAATSLLKPKGILFVSTINRTAKSFRVAIIGAEYVSGKVPRGTHDWNRFWSPEEVEAMVCDGSGDSASLGGHDTTMKQIALSGMVVNPMSMEWSMNTSDVDVNWIGAYQKGK